MRKYIFAVLILIISVPSFGQHFSIVGKIVNSKEKNPVEFATIYISDYGIWAVTNEKGEFTFNNLSAGKVSLKVSSLGYISQTFEVNVQSNISGLILVLSEDNLTLDEVVITAQKRVDDLTTAYTIDRNALDHTQILNVKDIISLLPGGKTTRNMNLAESDSERFSLRSYSGEKGNSSFGTAIEVDGVRIQNNAVFDETVGASSRNISSTNIESIEIITGIPSVEYGDLSNGIIKINTMKGKTPLIVDLSTKPHTKQAAINKGFFLGTNAGTLNANFEYAKSTQDIASPFTSYDRNSLTLTYSNTFNKERNQPIKLTAGFTGNIGGFNSKADPDLFKDVYTKTKDNTVRGNIRVDWLLNKPWITNLELSASISYSDKLSKENKNKDSSTSPAFIHTIEEGYFIATDYDKDPNASIILGPTGYWYELSYHDSKPIDYTAKLKGEWAHKFTKFTNRLMIGSEFSRSGNKGRGKYYDDMRFAPTWREYKYSNVPFINNLALYAEDRVTMAVNDLSTLQLMAGIRADLTYIKESEYGTVHSLSPRINMRYIFWERQDKIVSDLSAYIGWGKAVKLPSFEVLYPSPSYSDDLAFSAGTQADGTAYYGYYTIPKKAIYNPDLKWQHSKQTEVGIEANIKGTHISISAFRNKTYHPYMAVNTYFPYSYKRTDQRMLESCPIPSENRIYSIDQQTGVVTVTDKTNTYPTQPIDYITRNRLGSNKMYTNGSPTERRGIEWTVKFAPIKSLRTTIQLDGNFYHYKGIDETLIAWSPVSSNMADGNSYKYIGYYVGSSTTSTSTMANASYSNGRLSKQINANLQLTTHIPKVRLIVSMRIEASLYNYKKELSQYSGGDRGFVIESAEENFGTDTNIYGRDKLVAVYPLYYSTAEEPEIRIPFAEKFVWARDNDQTLYNELIKLVSKSNATYYFNPNKISSYFSANINITKEIGNFARLTFFANNFFNTMNRVKYSQNDTETLLYNSTLIPKFYYGLSLRIKI